MSYTISLRGEKCATCGRGNESVDCPDPTYNLTPIFDLALTAEPLPDPTTPEVEVVLFHKPTSRPRGLRLLDGQRAADTVAGLEFALRRLRDPALHDEFVALEPPNKWGTLPDAIWVVEQLLLRAKEYPSHVWSVR